MYDNDVYNFYRLYYIEAICTQSQLIYNHPIKNINDFKIVFVE